MAAPVPHGPDRCSTLNDVAPLLVWARERLGHDFADPSLLVRALTHGSAGAGNYQRLEFLGDRVLGCAVAAWLYRDHDDAEGRLTARLHALVEGPANATVARALGVPAVLIMERAARAKGLAQSDNVLGDVAEALVAALFLDGGWGVAAAFVEREWARLLTEGTTRLLADPKSELQRWALARRLGTPVYAVIDRQGPDHAPHFTVAVTLRGQPTRTGEGTNKQEAEKAAAVAMLKAASAT